MTTLPFTRKLLEVESITAFPEDDLMSLWLEIHRSPRKVAQLLFPDRPRGYVSHTLQLAGIVANLHAQVLCERKGKMHGASGYRTACDTIRSEMKLGQKFS